MIHSSCLKLYRKRINRNGFKKTCAVHGVFCECVYETYTQTYDVHRGNDCVRYKINANETSTLVVVEWSLELISLSFTHARIHQIYRLADHSQSTQWKQFQWWLNVWWIVIHMQITNIKYIKLHTVNLMHWCCSICFISTYKSLQKSEFISR